MPASCFLKVSSIPKELIQHGGMKAQTSRYNLEARTQEFALKIRAFVRGIPKKLENMDDMKQVIRSSGSVAANYIEANEHIGKDDFLMRIRICRKEAKESRFWLKCLASHLEGSAHEECTRLMQEAYELELIFGAVLRNRLRNQQ